jgi:hypothetical protein
MLVFFFSSPLSIHPLTLALVFLLCLDTGGFPFPLQDLATLKISVFNDTLFLSNIEVVDYSILVGVDTNKHELVLGIIGAFLKLCFFFD